MRGKAAIVFSAAILLGTAIGAVGQDVNDKKRPDTPPTDLKEGPHSGSENMGTTGWTGGAGTSRMGVTEDGPQGSDHPQVAKGLDPTKDKTTTASPPRK
jgi:hypothetical protein